LYDAALSAFILICTILSAGTFLVNNVICERYEVLTAVTVNITALRVRY
jgi:hypothetical protein